MRPEPADTLLDAPVLTFQPTEARVQPAAMPLAADAAQDPTSAKALSRLAAAASSLAVDARSDKLRQAIAALNGRTVDPGVLSRVEALALEVLVDDPESTLAWRIMATAREKGGDFSTALHCFEQVLKRDPDAESIASDLGRVAFHLAMFEQAEALFRLHLGRYPDDMDAVNNLGCALRDQMKYADAVELLKDNLNRDPAQPVLWNNLATVLVAMGEAERGMIFFDEAVRLDPEYDKAIYNRANLKLLMGDAAGAIEDGRRALGIARNVTDRAMMELALSLSLLGDGQMEAGWQAYEARRDPAFADVTLYPIEADLWEPGAPLDGKRLLLMGEQGLGDEVMFASMIPDLVEALGPAGGLFVATEPRLVSLLQRSFPQAVIGAYRSGRLGHQTVRIAPFVDARTEGLDYWAPGAAPLRQFRNSVASFPARRSYLKPDPDRVVYWRKALAEVDDQPKVGLLWKSLVIDPARSRFFSGFGGWEPVLRLKGVTLVNLQYGDCALELEAAAAEGIRIWNPPGLDLKDDLDELAALTVALDLVAGPANATTNIAAACGAEVSLVSLPGAWPQLGTTGWPWYPQLRVFVADGCGMWASAINALAQDITRRFSL